MLNRKASHLNEKVTLRPKALGLFSLVSYFFSVNNLFFRKIGTKQGDVTS